MAKHKDDEDEEEEDQEQDGSEDEEGDDGEDDSIAERRRRDERTQRIRLGILIGLSVVALVLIVMAVVNIVSYANSSNAAATPTTTKIPVRSPSDRTDSGNDNPMSNVLAGIGGLVCLAWVLLPFLYLLVSVLVGIWVIKDCRNRSMGDLVGVIWMLMIFPFNVIALIIYLGSRPVGHLVPCRRCRNPKLAHVLKCPHCQQRVESQPDE